MYLFSLGGDNKPNSKFKGSAFEQKKMAALADSHSHHNLKKAWPCAKPLVFLLKVYRVTCRNPQGIIRNSVVAFG
jgi:hypothetical protein